MKKSNIIFTILAVLTAVIIMGGILVGAYYFVINNNIYGLRDRYESQIAPIPLLRWALPEPEDPDDPKYLTDSEVRERYIQVKEERDQLRKQLEEANTEVSNLKIYKEEYEKIIKEAEDERVFIEEQLSEISTSRDEIQKLAAKNDTEGFRKYYEAIDPETAEEIYREIIQYEKVEQEKKDIIKIYEDMDGAAVARIFEEMGEQNMSVITGILSGMKKNIASAILSEMNPSFASKITEELTKHLDWDNSYITERR